MNKTLIIIPTYNEKDNIEVLLSAIYRILPKISVLFVDDNSADGTADEIRRWSRVNGAQENISILERAGKMGLGSAYIAGFKWGLARGYDNLIEMDADLSHNPKYLPVMIDVLASQDVAVGSRYIEGGGTKNWGFIRKLISRFGSIYARLILRTPLADQTGGFNGWRRQVLESIQLDGVRSEGYSFQIELKYRAFRKGFRMQEFPIVFEDRRVGQSKMSFGIVTEAFYRVWQIRFLV